MHIYVSKADLRGGITGHGGEIPGLNPGGPVGDPQEFGITW